MGDRRKRLRVEDAIEYTERRRSSRIIALEEKRREEKKRNMALALERKNNTNNYDNKTKMKDKGKAIINEADDLDDSSKDDGCRSKALHQPTSSIKEGQQAHNGSASRTNVTSILEKHFLECLVDILQRDDPDELFTQPVNLDMDENHCPIIKQPMDFGTMRAKLHDGLYTSFQQFKRDMFLMCSNAMNTNPANSRHHKVAKAISAHAKRLFEDLNAEPEKCDLEISLNKRNSSRKPQDGQPRTSQNAKVPPKPTGRKNAAISQTNKRDTFWSPTPSSNSSLVAEFLKARNTNIQLVQDASNYKGSLLKFVEDLGPTAKKVAAKKLEALKLQQQINVDMHSYAPPLFNRPLRIPSPPSQGNRNLHTNAGGVNIRNDYTCQVNTNENWNAYAAAILANIFLKNNKQGSGNGCESSNAKGTIEIGGPSKGKMVSPLGNVFPLSRPFQEGTSQNHEPQLGASEVTGSSNNVSTLVWPTIVIPKAKSIASSSPSRPLLTPHPRPQNFRPDITSFSELSLVHQPRPTESMSNINTSGAFLLPLQQMLTHFTPSNNLAGQPVIPQHAAQFSNEPKTSLHALGTPCEPRNFQALLSSSNLNSNPYPMQPSQQQVLHQASPHTASTIQGFANLQMQPISQMNPQALFHQQEAQSSSTLQTPSGGALNFRGGGDDSVSQLGEVTTLQLFLG